MVQCSVLGCKSNSERKESEISFHSFPKCPEIRDQWIEAVWRKNWQPTKYSRLCSRHFVKSSFITGLALKRLKTYAVPTIFEEYRKCYEPVTKRPATLTELQNDSESDSEDSEDCTTCDECKESIHGGRFVCAQCVDYELCARCTIERDRHRQHFLLRVPPCQPAYKVKMILQKLRSILEDNYDGSEDEETEIKMEMEEQTEAFDDPLTLDVKQEQEELKLQELEQEKLKEEELEHEKLEQEEIKQEVLVDNYDTLNRGATLFTYTKRRKEADDISTVPQGPELESKLDRGATAVANTPVLYRHSILKHDDKPSLRTFKMIPSVRPRVMPLIPTAPAVSKTSSQVQAPILVTRPTYLTGANRSVAVGLGAATDRPEDRELQTVPVSVGGRAPVRKHSLVIENLQIRVAKDYYGENEDVQLVSNRMWANLGLNTSKG